MTRKEAIEVVRKFRGLVDKWPAQWGKSYRASQDDFFKVLLAGEKLAEAQFINSDIRECVQCGLPGKPGVLEDDDRFVCIRCIPYPED